MSLTYKVNGVSIGNIGDALRTAVNMSWDMSGNTCSVYIYADTEDDAYAYDSLVGLCKFRERKDTSDPLAVISVKAKTRYWAS